MISMDVCLRMLVDTCVDVTEHEYSRSFSRIKRHFPSIAYAAGTVTSNEAPILPFRHS